MEISLFLAKFWGWYFIIFFLILSFNPNKIKDIFEDLKDRKFTILVAFIAIIVGLLNILFHNIWETRWYIIITLIGWAALIEGLLLFTFPGRVTKFLDISNVKLVQALYMLLFLVGLYLLNMGYAIVPY